MTYEEIAVITSPFVSMFFILLLTLVFVWLVTPSKSTKYRELLADMYVVGVIKQLAEKDKVNLNKELLEFNKVVKRTRLRMSGISEVVEDEIKEKIADVQEKNLAKK